MKRLIVFTAFLLTASYALAQLPAPAKPPKPPAAPAPPAAAAPAPPPAPAAPPPAPAPPAPPRKEGQPINVRVELTITEDGGPGAPIKKTVTAVVGDGFNGYVRERGVEDNDTPTPPGVPRSSLVAPLNLDAAPTILPNGKIRLACTIQYTSNQRPGQDRRINTDIKQNLMLILESGKTLTISEATDPISDRRVKVEVTATILK